MVLKKTYNEKTRVQKVWYESSMLVYSEMREDETDNKVELTVMFKNGSVYTYKDVTFEDYILLISGGLDGSEGKTFHKVIKTNYDGVKLSDAEAEKFRKSMNEVELRKEHTYFISGHRNITKEEFERNYVPEIERVIDEDPEAVFVVGDYHGADIMAQDYLMNFTDIGPDRIVVYCMGDSPANANESIEHFRTGFMSDVERDSAMTETSFHDIAFVREGEYNSGTAQNILRRHKLL